MIKASFTDELARRSAELLDRDHFGGTRPNLRFGSSSVKRARYRLGRRRGGQPSNIFQHLARKWIIQQ